MYMFDKNEITSLDDAVLVSFYRCLLVGRKKLAEESSRIMVEACEAEITARGIDLTTFRGASGFVS